MSCPLCQVKEKQFQSLTLYEDEQVMAILHPYPAQKGHVLVFPKMHVQIITLVPDEVLAKMYLVAQKLAAAVFDGLGAQGTNILLPNGELAGQTLPHFALHVLTRAENDGLKLDWEPKPAPQEELDATLAAIEGVRKQLEAAKNVIKGEENYQIKNLRRVP